MKREKPIEVTVYGAETICAGCHNLPSSRETASWLEAALGRNYGEQVRVRYVDIHHPEDKRDADFSRRVIEEELWYPVVVIDGEVVGEGNPRSETDPQEAGRIGGGKAGKIPGAVGVISGDRFRFRALRSPLATAIRKAGEIIPDRQRFRFLTSASQQVLGDLLFFFRESFPVLSGI